MTSESTRLVRWRAAEVPVTGCVLPLRGRHCVGVFLANLVARGGLPVRDELIVVAHGASAENDVPNAVPERVVGLHALAVRQRRVVAVRRIVDAIRDAGVLGVIR